MVMPRSATNSSPIRSKATLSISLVAPTRAATARNAGRSSISSRSARSWLASSRYSGFRSAISARAISSMVAPSSSPASTASAARISPRDSANASIRSAAERNTLRLDMARPSGSLSVGHPTISTGKPRSVAMVVMTASCWASLRPKKARSGWSPGEQLGHHGGHTVEVPGTHRALHPVGHRLHRHRREHRTRVHLLDGWCEHHVDARLLTHPQVPLERAGIPGQVIGVVELEWVHEDRDHQASAPGASGGHQRSVACMESPHGRDQSDHTAPRGPPGRPRRAERGGDDHRPSTNCAISSHRPAMRAVASTMAAYRAPRSGDTPAAALICPATVPMSPRATGPVRAWAGPRS
jgi:hypothetical protein